MPDIFDPIACSPSGHHSLDHWNALINAIAPKHGVPPNLVKAHMEYESDGNPSVVGGSGRGLGLMQIDYGTYKLGGVWWYAGPNGTTNAIFDPANNILIACRDFIAPAMQAFPDNLDAVVAAYNAGIGPVQAAIDRGDSVTTVTFRPWYVPSITAAFSYFNAQSHKALDT